MNEKKRSRFQIYFDILRVLSEEIKPNSKPSLTRVAHEANLPYDRFQTYVDHLFRLNMISYETNRTIALTNKGLEYIREYQKINDFLRRMGLLP